MAGEEELSTPLPRALNLDDKPNKSLGGEREQMAKFIMSIGDEAFKLLASEADNRDVTVQQLLRAVVVPEWIRGNLNQTSLSSSGIVKPPTYGADNRQNGSMLLSPVNRLRH